MISLARAITFSLALFAAGASQATSARFFQRFAELPFARLRVTEPRPMTEAEKAAAARAIHEVLSLNLQPHANAGKAFLSGPEVASELARVMSDPRTNPHLILIAGDVKKSLDDDATLNDPTKEVARQEWELAYARRAMEMIQRLKRLGKITDAAAFDAVRHLYEGYAYIQKFGKGFAPERLNPLVNAANFAFMGLVTAVMTDGGAPTGFYEALGAIHPAPPANPADPATQRSSKTPGTSPAPPTTPAVPPATTPAQSGGGQ